LKYDNLNLPKMMILFKKFYENNRHITNIFFNCDAHRMSIQILNNEGEQLKLEKMNIYIQFCLATVRSLSFLS
jgi:hypothetical protein